jgi:hypothetical protein
VEENAAFSETLLKEDVFLILIICFFSVGGREARFHFSAATMALYGPLHIYNAFLFHLILRVWHPVVFPSQSAGLIVTEVPWPKVPLAYPSPPSSP